jgi:tetratricopeptide (TPR) repeat protein
MLGIPFLTAPTRSRSTSEEKSPGPGPKETIREAKRALDVHRPSHAHSLVAPMLDDPDCPAEARLAAGRALAAQGRYPEAMQQFVIYISGNPDSVQGLISAALTAARIHDITRAIDWFNRAAHLLKGRAKNYIKPILESGINDAVAIEDMVADVEAHPEDKERALALAIALGCAGHFRAVERFLPSPG